MLSCVQLFATPWTVAHQTPWSTGFSRHEYWSGLPFLLQGIFPTQGLNLGLPHCSQTLCCLSHQGSQFGRLDKKLKGTHQVFISNFSCLNILPCYSPLSSHVPQFLHLYLHPVTVERLSESTQCLKACLARSKRTTTTRAVIVIITNIVPSAAQTQIGFCFSKVMLGRKVFLSVTLVLP